MPVFVFRIAVRTSGRKFLAIFSVLITIFQIFVLKIGFFSAIFPWIGGLLTLLVLRRAEKTTSKPFSERDFLLFLDQLTLSMSSGTSLNASFAQIVGEKEHIRGIFGTSDLALDVGRGRKPDFLYQGLLKLQILSKNSSMAMESLKFLRETYRLRLRLQEKQRTISLQARAQAVLTTLLYLLIMVSQIVWNPDFVIFVQQKMGKVALIASVLLLVAGHFVLKQMTQPKELKL